jgi:hypothetical protein
VSKEQAACICGWSLGLTCTVHPGGKHNPANHGKYDLSPWERDLLDLLGRKDGPSVTLTAKVFVVEGK